MLPALGRMPVSEAKGRAKFRLADWIAGSFRFPGESHGCQRRPEEVYPDGNRAYNFSILVSVPPARGQLYLRLQARGR
jgi:hypothetical protein